MENRRGSRLHGGCERLLNRVFIGLIPGACADISAQAADTAPSAQTPAPGVVNPGAHEQPDWFKQSFLDLREDVGEARAADKRLMVYFYQDGCPYCARLLCDNIGQRRIGEATQRYFDVVASTCGAIAK